MRYTLPSGGVRPALDAATLRTWGAAMLRPYKEKCARLACRRGKSKFQRVQKVPLSQLMRLPPLVTMPLMTVPDQLVVSWRRESHDPVALEFASFVSVYVWPRRRM